MTRLASDYCSAAQEEYSPAIGRALFHDCLLSLPLLTLPPPPFSRPPQLAPEPSAGSSGGHSPILSPGSSDAPKPGKPKIYAKLISKLFKPKTPTEDTVVLNSAPQPPTRALKPSLSVREPSSAFGGLGSLFHGSSSSSGGGSRPSTTQGAAHAAPGLASVRSPVGRVDSKSRIVLPPLTKS